MSTERSPQQRVDFKAMPTAVDVPVAETEQGFADRAAALGAIRNDLMGEIESLRDNMVDALDNSRNLTTEYAKRSRLGKVGLIIREGMPRAVGEIEVDFGRQIDRRLYIVEEMDKGNAEPVVDMLRERAREYMELAFKSRVLFADRERTWEYTEAAEADIAAMWKIDPVAANQFEAELKA